MKKVSSTLRHAFFDGSLKYFAFAASGILLAGFLLTLFFDSDAAVRLRICFFFLMALSLVTGYLSPGRRYREPKTTVPDGSDAYLNQKDMTEPSQEEREALLQESWLAVAERFNKNRKV